MKRRLLILSTSRRHADPPKRDQQVRAIDLFDGQQHKIVRNYLRDAPMGAIDNMTIAIFSAELGWISGYQMLTRRINDPIMTAELGIKFSKNKAQQTRLQTFFEDHPCNKFVGHPDDVERAFSFMGAEYDICMRQILVRADRHDLLAKITFADGRIGMKLAHLKRWLAETEPSPQERAELISRKVYSIECMYDGTFPDEVQNQLDAYDAELRKIHRMS